jgi:hypothetical protein
VFLRPQPHRQVYRPNVSSSNTKEMSLVRYPMSLKDDSLYPSVIFNVVSHPHPPDVKIGWEIWRKPWWISTQNVFFQDFLLTITYIYNHMVKNEK